MRVDAINEMAIKLEQLFFSEKDIIEDPNIILFYNTKNNSLRYKTDTSILQVNLFDDSNAKNKAKISEEIIFFPNKDTTKFTADQVVGLSDNGKRAGVNYVVFNSMPPIFQDITTRYLYDHDKVFEKVVGAKSPKLQYDFDR